MAAPAAAPGESLLDGVVANRIKDLERKLGEAQKKFNKVEADEKGQTSPTLQGEDADSGTLTKSGADRIQCFGMKCASFLGVTETLTVDGGDCCDGRAAGVVHDGF